MIAIGKWELLLLASGIFVGVIDIRSSCCAITYDEIMGRLDLAKYPDIMFTVGVWLQILLLIM